MIQLCPAQGICLLAKNVKSCQQGEKLYLPAELGEIGSLPIFLRLNVGILATFRTVDSWYYSFLVGS